MTYFSQAYPVLADMSWLKVPLLILFVLAGVVLILVVLVQTTKGGGLAGAFGMGGDTTVLGTKAGTFLGKVTAVAATIFLLLALIYAMVLQSGEKGGTQAAPPAGSQQPETPEGD